VGFGGDALKWSGKESVDRRGGGRGEAQHNRGILTTALVQFLILKPRTFYRLRSPLFLKDGLFICLFICLFA